MAAAGDIDLDTILSGDDFLVGAPRTTAVNSEPCIRSATPCLRRSGSARRWAVRCRTWPPGALLVRSRGIDLIGCAGQARSGGSGGCKVQKPDSAVQPIADRDDACRDGGLPTCRRGMRRARRVPPASRSVPDIEVPAFDSIGSQLVSGIGMELELRYCHETFGWIEVERCRTPIEGTVIDEYILFHAESRSRRREWTSCGCTRYSSMTSIRTGSATNWICAPTRTSMVSEIPATRPTRARSDNCENDPNPFQSDCDGDRDGGDACDHDHWVTADWRRCRR